MLMSWCPLLVGGGDGGGRGARGGEGGGGGKGLGSWRLNRADECCFVDVKGKGLQKGGGMHSAMWALAGASTALSSAWATNSGPASG